MNGKKKETAKVLSQRMIAPDIYDLWLKTDLANMAGCGQFVGVYPKNGAMLLPRPISICQVKKTGEEPEGIQTGSINADEACAKETKALFDVQTAALRLVYRVAGKGTAEFSSLKAGDEVELLGVLGNGFPVEATTGKKVVLMGGGIGIPPMLQLAKELKEAGNEPIVIVGYRDSKLFLKEDLDKYGKVFIATEDGSVGTKGNVITAMKEEDVEADMIMACGPMPMLRAIKAYAEEKGIVAYISLEERMACGVGACLGCVCKTTKKDHHSHVNNARICTDGPVFDAREVDI